jgi:hypothetical protein
LNLLKAACSITDPVALLSHINLVVISFQKLQKRESKLWITSIIDYLLYLLARYQNPERLNFFWSIRNEFQQVLLIGSENFSNNNGSNSNSDSINNSPQQQHQSPEGIAPTFTGFNFNEFLNYEPGPILPEDDLTTDFNDLI